MDLSNIRSEIDRIDREMTALFAQRMDAVAEVARQKKESGALVRDAVRERQIVARLTEQCGDEYAPYLKRLYGLMFDLSRSYQMSLMGQETPLTDKIRRAMDSTAGDHLTGRALVAVQGTQGSYGEQACEKLFEYPDILYFDTFEAVFQAVEKGMCRYGILPVENSTAGSVTQVYDLMEQHAFRIVGAQKLRIDHRLMRRPGAKGKLREVVSHEQALRQCSGFFAANPAVKAAAMENTAVAAQFVAKSDRDDIGVIASGACAALYGLEVVDDAVADNPNNFTRFVCISRELEIYPDANKISLMLTLSHEPGSLSTVLSRLAIAGINLVKLESRPVPGSEFEFRFFFDLEGFVRDESVIQLLGEMQTKCERFVLLGSYNER